AAARIALARLLRPPRRLQPIAVRRAFARRVWAPLAAVPLVELVHAFGVAKVAACADFLAADPRVEGVVAPLGRAVLAHGRSVCSSVLTAKQFRQECGAGPWRLVSLCGVARPVYPHDRTTRAPVGYGETY